MQCPELHTNYPFFFFADPSFSVHSTTHRLQSPLCIVPSISVWETIHSITFYLVCSLFLSLSTHSYRTAGIDTGQINPHCVHLTFPWPTLLPGRSSCFFGKRTACKKNAAHILGFLCPSSLPRDNVSTPQKLFMKTDGVIASTFSSWEHFQSWNFQPSHKYYILFRVFHHFIHLLPECCH